MYLIALPCTELSFPERQIPALDNRIFFPSGRLRLGFLAGSLSLHVCYLIPWQPQQACLRTQISVQRQEGAWGTPRQETCWGCPRGPCEHPFPSRCCRALLAAACCYFIAPQGCGERKRNQTPMHVSQLHLMGKQKAVKCGRACTASVTGLLVCLGHSDIWGGLIGF